MVIIITQRAEGVIGPVRFAANRGRGWLQSACRGAFFVYHHLHFYLDIFSLTPPPPHSVPRTPPPPHTHTHTPYTASWLTCHTRLLPHDNGGSCRLYRPCPDVGPVRYITVLFLLSLLPFSLTRGGATEDAEKSVTPRNSECSLSRFACCQE